MLAAVARARGAGAQGGSAIEGTPGLRGLRSGALRVASVNWCAFRDACAGGGSRC